MLIHIYFIKINFAHSLSLSLRNIGGAYKPDHHQVVTFEMA